MIIPVGLSLLCALGVYAVILAAMACFRSQKPTNAEEVARLLALWSLAGYVATAILFYKILN